VSRNDSSRITHHASRVMERCATLARYSEETDRLTRRFATPPMRQVNGLVSRWMQEASMSVYEDNIGNLIGCYEAEEQKQATSRPLTPNTQHATPTLVLGSHLDTVRDAGKYDGPLGVMVALACVQHLHEQSKHLPFAIEVVAFADEEGLRFHTSYLGSKVYAGTFDPDYLELKDADGITVAEAIRDFGGDPYGLENDKRDPQDLIGYCEVHIEQGPVLEAEGIPVGVVSAIAGQSRISVEFKGEAGHAGTVPMHLRHDALVGAAEFVTAVETLAKGTDLVATVGQLAVQPGASNVIPGLVTLSLDVRHQEDSKRERAVRRLRDWAEQICTTRGLSLDWRVHQANKSMPCSKRLSNKLAEAVEASGHPVFRLPSGAGHDAVTMSAITDVAMLFVRCKGGISHNPAESVSREDVAVAIEVMGTFLQELARGQVG
jgi:allantoate deiminase